MEYLRFYFSILIAVDSSIFRGHFKYFECSSFIDSSNYFVGGSLNFVYRTIYSKDFEECNRDSRNLERFKSIAEGSKGFTNDIDMIAVFDKGDSGYSRYSGAEWDDTKCFNSYFMSIELVSTCKYLSYYSLYYFYYFSDNSISKSSSLYFSFKNSDYLNSLINTN